MPKPFRNTFKPKQSGTRMQPLGGTWAIGKYERDKQRWIEQNPTATPQEYERAMAAIASACNV